MNDQDYIRKAVELADGWLIQSNGVGGWNTRIGSGNWYVWPLKQEYIDALTAQLVRQVDATKDFFVNTYPACTIVERTSLDYEPICSRKGSDRTMNTIKAIVDSGVLE